jgi:ABC-type dipeptide/oligopeptide/nickel transport system ATPase component
MVRFIFEQLRARGISILFITHDMRLVAEHAGRVMVMHEGQLVFDGTPPELFRDPDLLERAELLAPPVIELTNALVEKGYPLSTQTATLEQFNRAIETIFTSRNGAG